jgi:uncharacterized protein
MIQLGAIPTVSYRHVMRPLRALGIYALLVFIGGAVLAPWVYWLVQQFPSSFPSLASRTFHRYVSTTLLIIAVVGLVPLLRSLGSTSLRDAGLENLFVNRKMFAAGLMLGVGSLAVTASVAVVFGARQLSVNLAASKFAEVVLLGGVTAIGVALLEETLFRGGIFGGLRRVFQWPFALLLSSIIYSAMHFMEDTKSAGAVRCWSGLEVLLQMFTTSAGSPNAIPRFLNLLIAGVLLGLAYQRTGNLWFSIGLHAGWIFCLTSYRALTDVVPNSAIWFWGTARLIDGWAATFALVSSLFIFLRFSFGRRPDKPP